MQRLVIVEGQRSRLLYGDPEVDHPRFQTQVSSGDRVDSALPILLRENWVIEGIIPLNGLALVTLRESRQGSEPRFPSR